MQPLVPFDAPASSTHYPDNWVTTAISGSDKRRAATAIGPCSAPTAENRGRVCCSNAERRKLFLGCAKSHIGALLRSIGNGRLDDAVAGIYAGLRHRQTDSPQIITIKQITDGILAKSDNQTRRRCAGHIHQQWPAAAQIEVPSIQIEPIEGRPIIAGRAGKDWAGLEAYYGFAAAPSGWIESVTSGNKRVLSIAGDTAHTPYRAADRVCRPSRYAGWIIDGHAHEPAMIQATISHAPIADIENVAHDAERRSLLLDRWSKLKTVISRCRLHVHGPARIDVAGIQTKGKDEMFLGLAAVRCDHCVEKKRA